MTKKLRLSAAKNSIVSGLSTKQTEQQAERKGNEAFERAKAAGMTDTQAQKVATDETLSMLPPDKRRQLLIDSDGKRLSIIFRKTPASEQRPRAANDMIEGHWQLFSIM